MPRKKLDDPVDAVGELPTVGSVAELNRDVKPRKKRVPRPIGFKLDPSGGVDKPPDQT